MFRIYYVQHGGHVHCRVFTDGLNGTLIFSEAEWSRVRTNLERIAEVKAEVHPDFRSVDAGSKPVARSSYRV